MRVTVCVAIVVVELGLSMLGGTVADSAIDLAALTEIDPGQPIGQLRAVPVNLGADKPKAVAALHGAEAEIDPYIGMFFFPKSTLKLDRTNQKLSGVGYNLFVLGGI